MKRKPSGEGRVDIYRDDPVSSKQFKRTLIGVIIINAAVGSVMLFPAYTDALELGNHHREVLNDAIDSIPSNATLLVQNDIYPYVAQRENTSFAASIKKFRRYQNHSPPVTPEYILIDTKLTSHGVNWAYPILHGFETSIFERYGVLNYSDGVWVLKYNYTGPTSGVGDRLFKYNRTFTANQLSVGVGFRQEGNIIKSENSSGRVWFGPYATLPAGNYTAHIRLYTNTSNTSETAPLRVEVAAGKSHHVIERKRLNPDNGWQTVTVTFELNEATRFIEVRGWAAEGRKVVLDWMRITAKSGERSSKLRPPPARETPMTCDVGFSPDECHSGRTTLADTASNLCSWIRTYPASPLAPEGAVRAVAER